MTPVQPYSYRGAALSTIYYAPDGVNWWPSLTEIFTQARQVWLDGYWCFYPLEIQQEGGKPYGQGQPQEALGQPQLADLFGTYMSGWPGTASTWPVGADFTDTNAHFGWAPVVCDDPNDNPPSPLPAVLYANGNPVSVGDTLGTLDQTWSVVVPFDPTGIFFSGSGTVPLTGPAAIHRLVSEYEKCLRVVNMGQGPVIYPH
jgi:hypothetical protein